MSTAKREPAGASQRRAPRRGRAASGERGAGERGAGPPPPDAPGAEAEPCERDRQIAAALAAWFGRAARDLPWRRTRDPYAIWLSEVMLQQTRVETVIPYYERFLARYPTVFDLAAAEIDDVLSLWSGLGYYRRARVLHLAAREVTVRHAGALPRDVSALRALPGVGAYTAGAIASIAYDRPAPLVDGNVARVLSRVEGIEDDIRGAAGTRRLWSTAERLVRAAAGSVQPGRFNQALMELGATVCTPRNPRCDACPVDGACVARAQGRQAELPVIAPKRDVPAVAMVAAVVRSGDRVLFVRRAEGGLFGGLWEPPMVEAPALADARALLERAGVAPDAPLREIGRVRHILTHRRLDVTVARAEVPAPWRCRAKLASPYEKAAWLDPGVLEFGVSKLARKVLSVASAPDVGAARRPR
ncbi:adenine glycosylase [Sorangium cellulosum]|uniref:Adenine DNA glycosylase n=1 Tax=Sorangium cellulosum TaxID=56 RepID=A0A4V0NDM2_SORCE|nr:A/G-specific adenine glycosylase [Sorangium cellulosum]AUX23162.1 adenine glycosylase [Sorangium cellulosum]